MQLTLGTFVRGLFFIVVLVGAGLAFKSYGAGGILSEDWINANIRQNGVAGMAIFFAVAGLFIAGGFPRQIASFLGGVAFGLNLGTVIVLAASAFGCALAFYFARFLGRDWISARFPRRLKRADRFLTDNTFSMTLLIRLMPLGSNVVTNLVAGVSGARAFAFISGSTLGYIPQTFIFVLLGSGLTVDSVFRIILGIVLFAAWSGLAFYLYRRFRSRLD